MELEDSHDLVSRYINKSYGCAVFGKMTDPKISETRGQKMTYTQILDKGEIEIQC